MLCHKFKEKKKKFSLVPRYYGHLIFPLRVSVVTGVDCGWSAISNLVPRDSPPHFFLGKSSGGETLM